MRNVDAWLDRTIEAVPVLRRFRPWQSRLASFGEQGMQGVANVAVNIILARALSQEGFATIGMMLAVHFFVFGVHRTAIVLPFILDAGDDPENHGRVERRWWWLNLLSIAIVAALIAAATLIVYRLLGQDPNARWFREGLALSILVTPSLLLFEFGRRVLYHLQQPAAAALCSAVYLLLNLGFACLVTVAHPTPFTGSLAWIVAGLGCAALATWIAPPGRPQLREAARIWWAHRSFAILQSLSIIPNAVYNTSVVVLIGTFGGAGPVAAFTAARTLTNPALSMMTAVDSLDKPRASRALGTGGLAALTASIAKTRRLLALITGSYLGLLILFAGPVLTLAYGDAYVGREWDIRILAVAFFLMCMNQPSETLLIMLRESNLMLYTRIFTAVTAVALLAQLRFWGVTGSCIALLLTHLVNLVALVVAERIAARRWRAANGPDEMQTGGPAYSASRDSGVDRAPRRDPGT